MATLNHIEQMNVKFTIVRNDDSEEVVETKLHIFDGNVSFTELRAAATEWAAGCGFTLGYVDEDDDFVVIGSQTEWQEYARRTDGNVDVMLRVADAAMPADFDADLMRDAFFMWHGMKGKGKGMHHFGKGKGCKRGRDWFARGSKADAELDASDDYDDADTPCKRMKTGDDAWALFHCGKGGKHGHMMMMHGMKGGKHHGHGMKGSKGMKGGAKGAKGFGFEMPEHDDAGWMMHGFKGMKGGKKGAKGAKGFDFEMPPAAADDDVEMMHAAIAMEDGWGMKGMKGWKGGKGGKKGHEADDVEVSQFFPPCPFKGMRGDDAGEDAMEWCPEFSWKGGKGKGKGGKRMLMTMMMMGKGVKGVKPMTSWKGWETHRFVARSGGDADRCGFGGKKGAHMKGMNGMRGAHFTEARTHGAVF